MKKVCLFFRFMLIFFPFLLHCCEKDEVEDTMPPVCNITNPLDSAEYHIGDTITILVEANDHDGSIKAVLFYIDEEGKYSITESPYQHDWITSNEIPGFHTIRTTALDRGGNSAMDECIIKINVSPPAVITNNISFITHNSAISGGNVTHAGGDTVFARGVCWSISPNPTISDKSTMDGSGLGSFISSITGLKSKTTYFVRAYATNNIGVAYGNQVSFLTSIDLPIVSTTNVTSITNSSAQCGGNVIDDGGAMVIARGVCWNTTGEPTLSNYCTIDGTGTGSFTSSITGLYSNTIHYVRAYATNSEGTSYGNTISFSTISELAAVTTIKTSYITCNEAEIQANVIDDGGIRVTQRGICWSSDPNPTVSNNITIDGSGTGSFTASITGLIHTTKYFIRAYATNSVGTAYGNEIFFTTLTCPSCPGTPAVSDYDGNEYKTVQIGNQCWINENLKTTHYSDGVKLVDGTGAGDISADYSTEYYFAYNDDEDNVLTYGRLYTWAAVMNGKSGSNTNPSGVQGVCPTGWHVPSNSEWNELTDFVGGYEAGGKLKESGPVHWISPNSDASNQTGFEGLPSGSRYPDGVFRSKGYFVSYWTTTENNISEAIFRGLHYNDSRIGYGIIDKSWGKAVRCVKD